MNKIFTLAIALLVSIGSYAQTKIGIEFSFLGTNSNVIVPGLFSSTFDQVESGNGSDIGIGIDVGINEKISFRGGFRYWKWPFIPTVNGEIDNKEVKATETGKLHYYGIYLRLDRTWDYFFITGGFDISFANKFKNDLVIRDDQGSIILTENDREESILTDKFKNQFNLVLGFGPSIPIGDSFKVKGTLAVVVPFSPLYETGVNYQNPAFQNSSPGKVNLDFFPVFKYGISVEYIFGQ
ncbi:MAG TPA: hypothetical protein PKL31_14875 [Fulvivirga sp.]|nr:hypothetical protein [Fulvivirga sp.]